LTGIANVGYFNIKYPVSLPRTTFWARAVGELTAVLGWYIQPLSETIPKWFHTQQNPSHLASSDGLSQNVLTTADSTEITPFRVAPRRDRSLPTTTRLIYRCSCGLHPTFITAYPTEASPLSRRNNENPLITDRFELFISGREIANSFSALIAWSCCLSIRLPSVMCYCFHTCDRKLKRVHDPCRPNAIVK